MNKIFRWQGILTGDTSMNLLSAGFQAGAKAYSEIIFFEINMLNHC